MPFETILLALVVIAGLYMAWNIGANDVANAMGTSVGSGALTLRQAVIVAAFLEFSGAYFFGSHVSETMQKGIVEVETYASQPILLVCGMLASLAAAGVWLQVASYYGWPVSTTHTIVGAIVGFGVVSGGYEAIHWENVTFIVTSWLLSPLIGAVLSFLIFTFLRRNILYSSNPLEASKKLTPFLVFIVVSVLTFIMIFNGLKNINLNLSNLQASLICLSIGAAGSILSYFLVKGITIKPKVKVEYTSPPEVVGDLVSAKQHVLHLQSSAPSDMQHHVSLILEEMDAMQHSIKKTEELEVGNSEYAAVERIFGYLQIMSACLMAFAHGANDVANAIGPLSAALAVLSTGQVSAAATPVPAWALALGGFGIVVGLATWGWRVIETIGKKITELTPTRGFAAEFGAATTIVLASSLGMPISTTHTLVGSVLGVGFARGMEALNLSMTRDIFISWLVTVPAGAAITIAFYFILKTIFV